MISAATLCLGIVPIVSQDLLWERYAFTAGTFLVIFGVIEITEAVFRQGKS